MKTCHAPLLQLRPLHLHLVRQPQVVQYLSREGQRAHAADRLDENDARVAHAEKAQREARHSKRHTRAGAVAEDQLWPSAEHERG
jgi:hypothetical protein